MRRGGRRRIAWGPGEQHAALGSARGTDESAKMALDTTGRARIIAAERYAVGSMAAKSGSPDYKWSPSSPDGTMFIYFEYERDGRRQGAGQAH